MNYLIIFSVGNFTATINELMKRGAVGKITEGMAQSISLDIAREVEVKLMRVGEDIAICSVELFSDDLSESAVIEEVMIMLNNNGFAVTENEVVLYRKTK